MTFTNTTFPELESSCKQKLYTFTGKVHCVVLLDASVAVHVTTVVPTGNIDPDGGLQFTVTPVQLSVTAGVAKLTAVLVEIGHDAGAATLISFPHPLGKAGCWVSFTVVMNVQVPIAPPESVALQVTVVVPTGKKEPEAGEQATVAPGQLSFGAGLV